MNDDSIPTAPTRWCILTTSGGRTLAVARSLNAAGFEAWTPVATLQREKPGRYNGPRRKIEIDAPILPTFVFARATHLLDLLVITKDPASRHPPFSVMHHGQRVPLVAEMDILGMRQAEQEALVLIGQLREAASEKERRDLRVAALKNEHARRKALRTQYREFTKGQIVQVSDAPALVGMTGVIQSSDGRSALVAFGGSLFMKIETWQIAPSTIQGDQP